MDDLCEMKLVEWSFRVLKKYIWKRNLDVNGTLEELSARAVCLWQQQMPVDVGAQCSEMRLLKEYVDKLKIDNETLHDAVQLRSGWKGENVGMNMWPSIYITDISDCIEGTAPSRGIHKLMNEYKLDMIYQFFKNEWVREVLYHEISDNSDKCFLKAKDTISENK